MKNITLSADEALIERARSVARERNTTLNNAFREWLKEYTARKADAAAIRALFDRLSSVDLGGPKLTREEMNER